MSLRSCRGRAPAKLALSTLLCAATVAGCGGGEHAASRRQATQAPSTRQSTGAATTATDGGAGAEIAAAIARQQSSAYQARATYSFTVNAGTGRAATIAGLRGVFPAELTEIENARPGMREISVSSTAGTASYEINGSSVSVTTGGRRRPASGLELTAIRGQLAAGADFRSRLPDAGAWQLANGSGGVSRDLHVYPAAPRLASDLLPGYVGHATALHNVKLAIDVYLGPGGMLAGWRVALSCLADLNAISPHPAARPELVGVGLLATVRTRETG